MTDQEVFNLLLRIDYGYEPTEEERTEISHRDHLVCDSLEEVPKAIGYLTNLQELNLRNSKVSELPDTIGNLKSLQNLDLSNSKINKLPDTIGNLTDLQIIDLSDTPISRLPKTIQNLTGLQKLYLHNTDITEWPEGLENLRGLQSLGLGHMNLSELPDSIENLVNLRSLSLSGTSIKELPDTFFNLVNLERLYLTGIKIKELPAKISNLRNLKSIYLTGTGLNNLPEELGDLTNLEDLYIGYTFISKLPHTIGNFSHLHNLDARCTCLESLPDTINNLTELQALYLNNTSLGKLPDTVRNLKNLKVLDLSRTQISELPDWIGELSNLQMLILEDLTLPELPASLLSLNLEFKDEEFEPWNSKPGIYIPNLILKKQPVSLFSQPRALIEDYYRQPRIAINETKIIFLGSEGVGKTHTIKRILNDNHKISEEIKETPGISITSREFTEGDLSYRINFWDFGGQEIMHAMHRCFLTDRTGYVVVVSTRFGDVNKQARYWLRTIESFTNGAPVVIFVNEWSEGTFYRIDEYSLRRDYPNIIEVRQCSARDGGDEEFGAFVKTLQKMALANDSIAMSFPSTWEHVRQELIELGKAGSRKYYISQQEFRDKCRDNGIENEEIQTWLLEWFNDLGDCFSYQFEGEEAALNGSESATGSGLTSRMRGEEAALNGSESAPNQGKRISYHDLKVLNPEWLTNAIYIIIREAGDLAVNGYVSHEGIRNKLDHSDKGTLADVSYSADECTYVLEVMRKFRLSYKVSDQEQEFIPALLREQMPPDLDRHDAKTMISYEMRYKYLPENVIHNLMISMYPYLDPQRCWRKGMVIDVRDIFSIGLLAVLDMSREDEVLRIKVYSYADHAPWQLLQEIRTRLLEINDRMNLPADDYIIIDAGNETEAVSVEKLLKLKKRGKKYYQGDEEDYEIDELLGDTFGESQVRRMENVGGDMEDGPERQLLEKFSSGNELAYMREALKQPAEERLFRPANVLPAQAQPSGFSNVLPAQTQPFGFSNVLPAQAQPSEFANIPPLTCAAVCDHLLSACAQIQGDVKYWSDKEDSRSTQVRTILSNRGLTVRDQTLYGHAANSANPGEVDLMILKNNTDPLTIIEAMNLDSVNKSYIFGHLSKLLDDYNPNGLPELFLVSYVQKAKDKFRSFWESYCEYIDGMDVRSYRFIDSDELDTEKNYIKHMVVNYDCGGEQFKVHHICMRAGD